MAYTNADDDGLWAERLVLGVLGRQEGSGEAEIHIWTRLTDFVGIDGEPAEIVKSVEAEGGLDIDEREAKSIKTVHDLVQAVKRAKRR